MGLVEEGSRKLKIDSYDCRFAKRQCELLFREPFFAQTMITINGAKTGGYYVTENKNENK